MPSFPLIALMCFLLGPMLALTEPHGLVAPHTTAFRIPHLTLSNLAPAQPPDEDMLWGVRVSIVRAFALLILLNVVVIIAMLLMRRRINRIASARKKPDKDQERERNEGRGTRDEGRGTRDEGRGTRDE